MDLLSYALAKQQATGGVDLSDYATKTEVAQVRTYKPFPSGWDAKATSSYTTKQFCDTVNADSNAVEGTVFLGEIKCSDLHNLPGGVNLVNGEAVVEIIKGTGTRNKTIHISLTSGNRTPYRWEYTYWNNGSNTSGWKGFYPLYENGIPKSDLSAEVQTLLNDAEFAHSGAKEGSVLGEDATAHGHNTLAIGDYSHAEGTALAFGEAAHAEGYGNSTPYTFVGQYNGDGEFLVTDPPIISAQEETLPAWSIYDIIQIVDNDVLYHGYIQDITKITDNEDEYYKITFALSTGYGFINTYFDTGEFYNINGYSTGALGQASHKEGAGTAIGAYSHAEGSSVAIGQDSHAEGDFTQSLGLYSHSEGQRTMAIGNYSHAEGCTTRAIGIQSHTEGLSTEASGIRSHAEGEQTIANHACQHVFGSYNKADTSNATSDNKGTYIEIVGNGNTTTRSNARTLDWSGNEVLKGTLTVSSNGITIGNTTITESQLQSLLALLDQNNV